MTNYFLLIVKFVGLNNTYSMVQSPSGEAN